MTQYDSQTGEGGLFIEYIKTSLKLKAEASGYPNHVCSEQDKYYYISEFYKSDGIILDKADIEINSAKRGLANFCINFFMV